QQPSPARYRQLDSARSDFEFERLWLRLDSRQLRQSPDCRRADFSPGLARSTRELYFFPQQPRRATSQWLSTDCLDSAQLPRSRSLEAARLSFCPRSLAQLLRSVPWWAMAPWLCPGAEDRLRQSCLSASAAA